MKKYFEKIYIPKILTFLQVNTFGNKTWNPKDILRQLTCKLLSNTV